MTNIENKRTIDELKEAVRLPFYKEIPKLSSMVFPVIDINPKSFEFSEYIYNITSTSNGTNTLLSIPSDKRFVITELYLMWDKDAACDATTMYLTITNFFTNASVNPIIVPFKTTTAERVNYFDYSPKRPIICKEGSNISFTSTFTAGTLSRSLMMKGYFVEIV